MKVSFQLVNQNPNSPAFKRLSAVKDAFEAEGITTFWGHEISPKDVDLQYLSFPPFPRPKELPKLLLTATPFIAEFRDGWSNAIKTGYGGTAPPRALRSFVVRMIERLIYAKAKRVITVTPGLVKWHGAHRTSLFPNGSEIASPTKIRPVDSSKPVLKAICFGKFLSYGERNVRQALQTLATRYSNNQVELHVYSGDEAEIPAESGHANVAIFRKAPVRPGSLTEFLSHFDLGVAIIRDPGYDFGTKIFDYAQAGLPALNYFASPNDVTEFFAGAFDTDGASDEIRDFSRTAMFEQSGLIDFIRELRK